MQSPLWKEHELNGVYCRQCLGTGRQAAGPRKLGASGRATGRTGAAGVVGWLGGGDADGLASGLEGAAAPLRHHWRAWKRCFIAAPVLLGLPATLPLYTWQGGGAGGGANGEGRQRQGVRATARRVPRTDRGSCPPPSARLEARLGGLAHGALEAAGRLGKVPVVDPAACFGVRARKRVWVWARGFGGVGSRAGAARACRAKLRWRKALRPSALRSAHSQRRCSTEGGAQVCVLGEVVREGEGHE
jgi:hypothetical protein